MFGHLPELAIILVLALIVFGPEKMPEMAHNAGKFVREIRDAMDTVMNPEEVEVPDDFSTYYQEEMESLGELPEVEYGPHARTEFDDIDLDPGGANGEVEPSAEIVPESEVRRVEEPPVEPPAGLQ